MTALGRKEGCVGANLLGSALRAARCAVWPLPTGWSDSGG